MLILGIIASALKKAISDLFTRTTSGSLGNATSGQEWTATRGTWFANGSQAQSNDSASTYPIASIPLGENITASASVSGGTGVSFWVTDANSWWASTAYNNSVTTGYSCTGTCYSSCLYCSSYNCPPETTNCLCPNPNNCACPTSYTCPCGTCSGSFINITNLEYPTSCNYWGIVCGCNLYTTTTTQTSYTYGFCRDIGQEPVCPSCPGGTTTYVLSGCGSGSWRCECAQTTTVNRYNASGYSAGDPRNCACPTSYTCACPPSYTCGCGNGGCCCVGGTYSCTTTCYSTSYYYFLRLINSVGGTVSTVTSDVSLPSQAVAILVQTSGNTITTKAYSDTGLTTQIGSTLSTTPSSPTKGNRVGIIKAPSDYNQGSTIDNFSATI